MADTKISALTAAGAGALANELAINEAGTSKKLTLQQVLDAINVLANAGALTDADKIAIIQSGVAKDTDLSALTAYFESRARVNNASVTSQTLGTADTYLVGSSVLIPANPAGGNRLQAKTLYRCRFYASKSLGTATATFTLRFGTAGSTADASVCALNFAHAGTAVADEAWFEVLATFRTVGAGTAAVITGTLRCTHRLTTTGFGGTGQGSVIHIAGTGSGFNSTVANSILGLSINPGASANWIVPITQTELWNLA